ncbi:glucose-6-phosphate dehydrogenase [Fusibacter ferrireducens]|uniref:Glucose-6-phosphate 1-dehydrogenase n=1 Tax=Fusibacter ferrireducens TaxID=2785058 RepID=A0ABR9ZSV1_9FIRM|nr:glucose-6-phosphate dehydrogenase [Fusibacter ferrireducens]MBF4692955.1 glucose-6-phosphate dehydrogenase [Fusibacter ferrireducens]
MIFTIFGATGDLTTKKLMPALYKLHEDDQMPTHFLVNLIGRQIYEEEAFIEHIRAQIEGNYPNWDEFKTHLRYIQMDFTDPDAYVAFAEHMMSVAGYESQERIYYLATAPRFFPMIASALVGNGLVVKGNMRDKIIFEKPFGENLETAKSYNQLLLGLIEESQIYRIDHYLGKEMLQNVLMVRFANKIFESIWDSENIEHITIYAFEKETVKQRGGYYDRSGALRDMVQNHLFQTLALVAMDSPNGLNDRLIKDEKVKVLEKLEFSSPMIFGQYKGYLSEKGIPSDSKTETFVGLKMFVNSRRWSRTPFYLVTGKKMKDKRAAVVITFKESNCFFESGQPAKNTLTIEIAPREGLALTFNGKAPGLQSYVMPMKMDYCHLCNVVGNTPEAYEKLILDVIHDDASLFTRWDEIESSWKIIDQLEQLKTYEPLYQYEDESEMLAKLKSEWGDFLTYL